MSYDRFGNLIDDEGHDILDDDFEGEEWELDEDDFDISLEYDEDFDVSDPFDAEYDF